MPDAELVAEIRLLIAGLPTYGYHRIHVLLRRQARRSDVRAKSKARVSRHEGAQALAPAGRERVEERRHDGRVAVDQRYDAITRTAERSLIQCAAPNSLDLR